MSAFFKNVDRVIPMSPVEVMTEAPCRSGPCRALFLAGVEMAVVVDALSDALSLPWLAFELGCHIESFGSKLGV